jgi:hypothetical protein
VRRYGYLIPIQLCKVSILSNVEDVIMKFLALTFYIPLRFYFGQLYSLFTTVAFIIRWITVC